MLKGHSKFNLKLIKKSEGFFIQKIANSKIDVIRLKYQQEKQIQFREAIKKDKIIHSFFEIPKVVESSDNSFTMSFYKGKSVLDIFEKGDITILDDIINKLFYFLNWEFNKSIYKRTIEQKTSEKLYRIIEKGTIDKEIYSIISNLVRYINKNGIIVPIGICHGDFTLSNMLFSNKIILIDFLDSFIESPIQDIAKLLQEVNLEWSLLMSSGIRDITKIQISYNYLKWKIIQRITQEFPQYSKQIDLFYLITLLRIIPYIKEERIYKIVLKEIRRQKCLI